ncbi:MAG TPA: class I tRNA ligase family protein, partial [Candidatus Paceibacterota bacterium]|nr:class I tRNA ligase family protein [Candidatus Paceibacterota bacterium]
VGFDIRTIPIDSSKESVLVLKAYLQELDTLKREVTEDMKAYRMYLAAEKIYHYVWHTFADKILEESKPILASSDGEQHWAIQSVLVEILTDSLKLLHPFMPFVTEEIWQSLPTKDTEFLMIAPWPEKDAVE